MTTKDQVLAILLDSPGDAVSGEKLARNTGVSRSAIWKAVTALRAEGHTIEAVTNRGYKLVGEHEPISAAGIRRWLNTDYIGRNIEIHSVIGSTNARAKELARHGAPEGMVITARGQTEGKGRMGRKFHSPADCGVYLSIILRPRLRAEQAVRLTAMCAVAVARAIEEMADVHAGIKWVNDIFIGGKKTAGILCEAEIELETGMLAYAIAGIGINVSPQIFPEELSNIATSIGNVSGEDISKNRLIAEICNRIEALLRTDDFMPEYRDRSVILGKKVTVINGEAEYEAVAESIRDDGSLVVKTEFGTRTVRGGEIRLAEVIE